MHDAVPQLHDYLAASALRLPDKIALVLPEGALTYAELESRSNALARALVARGVNRGDRVVVLAENGAHAVISFWAALKANAVVSMVSPRTVVDKLRYVLLDCRAAALIAEGHLAGSFVPAAEGSEHLRTVIVCGPAEGAATAHLPGVTSWEDALRASDGDAPPPRRNIDIDLAAIVYTSGSTGEPKGVMLTHRNMLAAATSITSYLGMAEDDVVLCALPLSFDYGLYQMIMAVRQGARLVLLRSFSFPSEVLRAIAKERVTGLPGVPTMFAMLSDMKTLSEHDLSSVRFVTSTAAALPEKHIHFLRGLFPRARIFSMYGLTECKRCTYLPPEDLDRKAGSVGIAIPNTELWIVDEEGRRLGPGKVGQLVIRGATVMKGYWEKPEATAERLRPGPLPGEQVLYTGDYCKLDQDGYLSFVGRMDDILKSRGEKVPPKEVESALMKIEGVKEAAVIGVPDETYGQAVKAFVVPERGAILTPSALQRECRAHLESFMVPKHIEIVAELPRTSSGKIKKTDLH